MQFRNLVTIPCHPVPHPHRYDSERSDCAVLPHSPVMLPQPSSVGSFPWMTIFSLPFPVIAFVRFCLPGRPRDTRSPLTTGSPVSSVGHCWYYLAFQVIIEDQLIVIGDCFPTIHGNLEYIKASLSPHKSKPTSIPQITHRPTPIGKVILIYLYIKRLLHNLSFPLYHLSYPSPVNTGATTFIRATPKTRKRARNSSSSPSTKSREYNQQRRSSSS